QAWGQAREVIADAAGKAGIRNPFRFQGQYHDDESGLHYNRYRYYDPEIGRFISRDPIGLMGGINIHSYAPNPTEWVDPIGLSKKKTNAGTKAVSCPCEQDDPCGSPTKVDWTSHGGKHVPSKNASWKDTVKSTKTGAAKYKPEVNIQALERSAWATGTPVSTGGKNTSWKVASMPDVIGASEGKETNLMRVECSQGVIHGHPISQTEYNKLTRR
ncbi:RHS repeat-associated core domain-containing protein, partial [Chromobacterium piscinae]